MQFATLLIGLISATALWSGVQAINQQARNAYDRAAATFGGVRTRDAGRANDGGRFSQELFVKLRRAGWPVSPVAGGPRPDQRAFVAAARHRAGDAAGRGRQRAARSAPPDLQQLRRRARRRRWWRAETLNDLALSRKAQRHRSAAAQSCRRCACCRSSCPRCWWSISASRSSLLNKPDQVSRLLIGKSKGKPRAARKHRRRPVAAGRAQCGDRAGAPHRQLSSQPHRVRPVVVLRRPVHRQFGHGPCASSSGCRCCAPCGPAVPRRGWSTRVLVVELVVLALVAGLIGLVCGYFIAAALLPDVAASLARALWRADPGTA